MLIWRHKWRNQERKKTGFWGETWQTWSSSVVWPLKTTCEPTLHSAVFFQAEQIKRLIEAYCIETEKVGTLSFIFPPNTDGTIFLSFIIVQFFESISKHVEMVLLPSRVNQSGSVTVTTSQLTCNTLHAWPFCRRNQTIYSLSVQALSQNLFAALSNVIDVMVHFVETAWRGMHSQQKYSAFCCIESLLPFRKEGAVSGVIDIHLVP